MPTYEYKCVDCDRRFEAFQSMTDEPLTTCEECGGSLKRLIGTGAGFLFKGSGFYITDYRSDSYKTEAQKASSSSSSDSTSSSDGKKSGSETKSGGDAKAAPATTESKTK